MSSDLLSLVERLEKVATRLEQAAPTSAGGAAVPAASATGAADAGGSTGYDDIVSGSLKTFMDLSNEIGGDVATQAAMVEKAVKSQAEFLRIASQSKEPDQATLMELLKPTSTELQNAQQFRETNRRSNQFNHLSAVSEAIPALGWVTIKPKPCPYIKEMKDAAQFYTNRVLKEFKDNDEKQVNWAKSLLTLIQDIHDFVKATHTTGLVWKANGKDASAFVGASAPAASESKPAAPKPAAPAKAEGSVRNNLFAELSKGSGVTAGLKKVDRSQMTHKNPELRGSSVVPASQAKKPAAASAPKKVEKQHDPVFELQGKKWVVEYQKENNTIVIEGDIRQTVYIYKCERSTIQVKGKVNGITCDSCKKVGVVFDNCVSSFEFVNCQSMQVQVLGTVPTVSIDKTDGAQVYLSKDSLEANIVTAKSSEMNILVPKGDEGDFDEMPVPEQYLTVVKDGKLVTTPSEIAA